MIIKITANDNDFDYIFKYFCQDLSLKLMDGIEPLVVTDDFYVKFYKNHKKFNRLLNPNSDIVLTNEEKEDIINRTKEVFAEYLESRKVDKETSDYLLSKITVEIMDSFVDKWENGEAYYWCQHSNTVINQ